MSPRFLTLALLLAACSSSSSSDRIADFAAGRLGVDRGSLRVSSQSDLRGEHHTFHLVSRDGIPVLVVVEPEDGDLFDSKTAGAFDRVARAEQASARLRALGAERVSLWFGALGGGVCPMPSSAEAHFASVERDGDGVTIRYPAGMDNAVLRTCVVGLASDGSLRQARLVVTPTPQASARSWRGDAN